MIGWRGRLGESAGVAPRLGGDYAVWVSCYRCDCFVGGGELCR